MVAKVTRLHGSHYILLVWCYLYYYYYNDDDDDDDDDDNTDDGLY